MKLNTLFLASAMSLMALAGCSNSSSQDTAKTQDQTVAKQTTKSTKKTQTTDKKTADKNTSSSKTTTKKTSEDTSPAATEETGTASSDSSKTSAAAASTDSAAITTITSDLKSRGYAVYNDTVDWDNGIDASTVKQEIECDGVTDYTIWEFNSSADAQTSFDNVEKVEKLDYENSVARSGNLITITDKEDGDKEYYVLSDNIIVESDGYNALSDFQTWGLID